MDFPEDAVRIKLDGQEIPISTNYTVHSGVLEVPAQFEISVGHGGMFAALAAQYPPNTRFEMYIGDLLVCVGETDGYATAGTEATQMRLKGRDDLARLYDTEIEDESTFAEKTYSALTRIALNDCGLGDRVLLSLNAANTKAITGKEARQLEKKTVEDVTPTGTESGSGETKTIEVTRTLKGEVGHTWFEFLFTQYRRAGLFLWADHAGNFVLSQPNGAQAPLYRITRRLGSQRNEVNVTLVDFQNDTTHRGTEYVVIGRAGGGKHGRGQILARFIDDEMVALLNPDPANRADGGKRRRRKHFHDQQHVHTPAQAKLFARRKCAEARRNGWKLHYRVPGHSTAAIGGGRAVWQPDTVVEVLDDELGLAGPMYLESVTFGRTPETWTELHLMRIDDLVFAEEAPEVMKKRPKLQVRRGVTTVERPISVQTHGVNKTAWITDPSEAVGAPVIIDPDNEGPSAPNRGTLRTTNINRKPLDDDEPVS